TVARVLRERLAKEAKGSIGGQVLYNESVVMAALSFPELLRCAVPLTVWWQRAVAPAHQDWTRPGLVKLAAQLAAFTPGSPVLTTDPRLILKLIRIVGAIEMERQGAGTQGMKLDGAPSQNEVDAFASLF